jgi:SAM-dependent methyltransferase
VTEYNPEIYWSRVAQEIEKRGPNYIAGDDNPYYTYKRSRFLDRFLDSIDFGSRTVLELGFGPGGNLGHVAKHHAPKKLLGVDISQNMLALATNNLSAYPQVELTKIDGVSLPYLDRSIDLSFTVTVLHHNTDESMFRSLVSELCRVTNQTVVVMEDIGTSQAVGGRGDWIGRSVDVYKSAFAENGFQLSRVRFLDTKISRTWNWLILGLYRRSIIRTHYEGERMATFFRFLIWLPMPITRFLDNIIVDKLDLAKMEFNRLERA